MTDEFIFDTSYGMMELPKSGFKCSGFGLVDLVDRRKDLIGLEIGCDVGDTSFHLLNTLKKLTLHSIDPYTDYIDWNGNDLVSRHDTLDVATKRLSTFGERFILHRKTSDDAVEDFHDDQFDFIFIDGLHTYDQLSKDCENYYSKLKTGGIFSGHDFTAIAGVNRAATEFANKIGKKISLTDVDVWYWVK